MRTIILTICIFVIASCGQPKQETVSNPNPEFENNLATAKKFFALFNTEDLEAQIPMICPGVTHYPPFYGSEPGKYDAFVAAGKAWMDNFDDITYNAEVWLPGTDSLGALNGSVRTYGTWTAKNTATGAMTSSRAYHSFEFNPKGQIHEVRDYFDASGTMAAAMNQ